MQETENRPSNTVEVGPRCYVANNGQWQMQPSMALRCMTENLEGDLPVGGHVHPYKLAQRLVEGGYEVVHRAERIDPVRRDVALRSIKPGMDSKAVIARFEAARPILANMVHPNISKFCPQG